MKRPFRYLRDPVFLACLAIYFINRLVLKPYLPNVVSQNYLNDLICIPFWVPIMLFTMRRLGLRRHDRPPGAAEVLVPLLVWSWLFESVAPYSERYRGLAFGDPLDILCYVVGAFGAVIGWDLYYRARWDDCVER